MLIFPFGVDVIMEQFCPELLHEVPPNSVSLMNYIVGLVLLPGGSCKAMC